MDIFKNVQKKYFENTFVTIFLQNRKNPIFYYRKSPKSVKKLRELLKWEGVKNKICPVKWVPP